MIDGIVQNLMLVGSGEYQENPHSIESLSPERVLEFFAHKKDGRLRYEHLQQEGAVWREFLSKNENKGLLVMPLSLNHEEVGAIYSLGVSHYKGGSYKHAFSIFRYAFFVNPSNYEYSFALASVLFQMKYYLLAAEIFKIAAANDERRVAPYFQAAECYLSAGIPFLAMNCWEYVIYHQGAEDLKGKEALVTKAKLQFDCWIEMYKSQVHHIHHEAPSKIKHEHTHHSARA